MGLNHLNGAFHGDDGILPVMELGGGFKCYKRGVFEAVSKNNPSLWFTRDETQKREFAFFCQAPVKDEKYWPGLTRMLTEDYWLDWLCRDAGILPMADIKIKLRHFDERTGKVFPEVFPDDPGQMPAEAKEL